jgi:GTP-binding protein HflX
MWTHLEKQRGGIGLRGPGEQEIETDRRILRYRISLLKKKLEEIDKQKTTQRKNRRELVRIALVGYTNVGKSTIMNLLSKSNVFAENKLFATLDTTVRKVVIHDLPFLLSDTVGFIRKLPHTLIESFKSTLDEVREADILVHIVDISHPAFEEQIEVVNQTLTDIGASDKPVIMLFNKIDQYSHVKKEQDDLTPVQKENLTLTDLENTWMAKNHLPSIFISAREKTNIARLKEMIYQEVLKIRKQRYPSLS